MHPTPTTRPRHALRWVVGVGLVFVVVVGLALLTARRQADERWESVVTHWDEARQRSGVLGPPQMPFIPRGLWSFQGDNRGGNIFRSWTEDTWHSGHFVLDLRQELNAFGSSIGARISGGEPDQIEAVRAIFAEVDIDLIVEP